MRIADTASIQYPGENDETRLAQDPARDVGRLCLAAMMAQDLYGAHPAKTIEQQETIQ
jgi:hypothetical protein